ncbi:hypothetical protein GN109_23210 [Collimonas pratensis]|uniref:esterase/lipase family protein n=1 Tax=Collimonas pratensis TaxID=279113 RepID=UPI00143DF110|nr:hypothetical protein [Collimonas pratensis]NKI72339.1 hypothetical protein [Collimonas pratensis]
MTVQGEDQDIWLDFTLGVNQSAEVGVQTTPTDDKRRIRVRVPPGKLIPIVFFPGIMGSNLRLSKKRQAEIQRQDNRSWRPDDKGDALKRRNASAAERQMRLDPDEVEVDHYEISYDKDKDRFESTGNATQTSDSRHDNVPDNLADVSKLLMSDPKLDNDHHPLTSGHEQHFSAAQKARARGWSEVMFGSYGKILMLMEKQLNDMLKADGAKVEVSASWASKGNAQALVGRAPASFGNSDASALTEADIKKIGNCWYPVHAFGYNWLKSNGDEAQDIAPRIQKLIDTYNQNGFDCPGVILVTHSMGGLLARGLMHPDYGNLKDKVLGVVHGVMPTTGAAAAYKRLRAGFEGSNKTWWHFLDRIQGGIVKGVLGDNGEEVTAVLANAPGGLELLPNKVYGSGWLKVQDRQGNDLMLALPKEDPAAEIYTQEPQKWWRVINPEWIDPAKMGERGMKGAEQVGPKATKRRIINAMEFSHAIQDTFHDETYAHFGEDPAQLAWNDIVWKVTDGNASAAGDPLSWTLLEGDKGDNAQGTIRVLSANGIPLTLQLQPSNSAADGTVPVERSADKVRAKVKFRQTGYDHQGSYDNEGAQAATLYGVVKIANAYKSEWWDKKD